MGKFIPPVSTGPYPVPPIDTGSVTLVFAQKEWLIKIKNVEERIIIEDVD
jgi:hypothetical protein